MNENKVHIMIDLETLSHLPNAAIRSIGAVAFDLKGNTEDLIHIGVDLESCMKLGMGISGSTVDWWLDQSKEAQDRLLCLPKFAIKQALLSLNRVCESVTNRNELYVWSHGANFDMPILQYAYHVIEVDPCWKYSNVRDTRTLLDLAKYTYVKKTICHDAIEDARNQAVVVIEAYQKLKGGEWMLNKK